MNDARNDCIVRDPEGEVTRTSKNCVLSKVTPQFGIYSANDGTCPASMLVSTPSAISERLR